MITFTTTGSFDKTEAYLRRMTSGRAFQVLDRFGEMGRAALARATPIDSGETANSWSYKVIHNSDYHGIEWSNSNNQNGLPIAILLQYGHGTGTGGYVQGRDYINPVIKPIFDQIAQAVWEEVTRA